MITAHDVKICGYIGPIIAAVATLTRLGERLRTRRFGYDDAFAALSLLILVAFDTALFVHLADQTHLSRLNRFAMYYVISQSFYGIIWAARLSILFTVIRITVEGSKLRRILHVVAGTYIVIWVVLAAQLLWICERHDAWKDLPSPQCPLENQVPIAQLITDIYADSVLIIAPLRLLWNLEAGSTQRARLIVAFSASIVTTITSLVHAYYILKKPGSLAVIFTAIVELSSSLFVCNLAILVGTFAKFVDSRGHWWSSSSARRSESHELSNSNSGSRFSSNAFRSKSIHFRRDAKMGADERTTIRIDLQTETTRDVDGDVNPDHHTAVYPIKAHQGSPGESLHGSAEEVYKSKSGIPFGHNSPV